MLVEKYEADSFFLRAGEGSISESEKTCGFFFEGNSYVYGSSGNSGMDCDFGIRKDIDSINIFLKRNAGGHFDESSLIGIFGMFAVCCVVG